MPDLPPVLLRAGIDLKKIKFLLVSAIAVPFSQAVFFLCHKFIELDAELSNLIAVTAGCVPSYLLNRYWVWGKRGRNQFWREVFPFWALAVLGLILSTVAVYLVDQRTDVTIFLMAANLSAFAVLYVVKFIVLDRVLFAVADEMTHHAQADRETQPLPLA
jgi:putative flippase GtrA